MTLTYMHSLHADGSHSLGAVEPWLPSAVHQGLCSRTITSPCTACLLPFFQQRGCDTKLPLGRGNTSWHCLLAGHTSVEGLLLTAGCLVAESETVGAGNLKAHVLLNFISTSSQHRRGWSERLAWELQGLQGQWVFRPFWSTGNSLNGVHGWIDCRIQQWETHVV